MKAKLILTILLICFFASAYSQTAAEGDCAFLKHVKFKQKTDTLIINAVFGAMIENVEWPELKQLEKEGKLKNSNFQYVIAFKVKGCAKTYAVPSSDMSKAALGLYKVHNSGKPLQLTCVVFEGYYNKGEPFFVVTKVKPTP